MLPYIRARAEVLDVGLEAEATTGKPKTEKNAEEQGTPSSELTDKDKGLVDACRENLLDNWSDHMQTDEYKQEVENQDALDASLYPAGVYDLSLIHI